MAEFNASLLREKFIITDAIPSDINDVAPVIALSNRMMLPLVSDNEKDAETFVVRAQNMHVCTRMAASIAYEFQQRGLIMDRKKPLKWKDLWNEVIKGYEETWNPKRWVAVYHKGRVLFEEGPGQRHLFADVIEQCDARNKGEYAQAVKVAEEAFKQAGKMVNIAHDSNIALIMSITRKEGKCGLIVRSPARTTTFNMTMRKKKGAEVRPSQCMTAAAAFLEGIQLCFRVGMARQKLKFELISPASPEGVQAEDAGRRLGRLNTAVTQLENILEISYRPDRPEFSRMIDEAQEFALKVLSSDIAKKIEADPSGWVA